MASWNKIYKMLKNSITIFLGLLQSLTAKRSHFQLGARGIPKRSLPLSSHFGSRTREYNILMAASPVFNAVNTKSYFHITCSYTANRFVWWGSFLSHLYPNFEYNHWRKRYYSFWAREADDPLTSDTDRRWKSKMAAEKPEVLFLVEIREMSEPFQQSNFRYQGRATQGTRHATSTFNRIHEKTIVNRKYILLSKRITHETTLREKPRCLRSIN